MDHIVMARRRKFLCCSSHKPPTRKPTQPHSGKFKYTHTFLERRYQKKLFKRKHTKQLKIVVDGTKHTVRKTGNKNFHRELICTPLKFPRSQKKDVSPIRHTLRGPNGKCASASEKTQKVEERTFSESKPKVRKLESDEDDSGFEFYIKSDGKSVHVDIDKKVTEGGSSLALLWSRSEEEEMINNGETIGGNSNISIRRSNRAFKPPDRLDSVSYFRK